MSLLPGVPNMSPAPVSPTGPGIVKASVGKPGSFGQSPGAKFGNTQHLGSVVGKTGKGLTAVGGGDTAFHGLNDYGKSSPPGNRASSLLGAQQMTGGVDPTAHQGVKQIRGSSGGIHRNKVGGLGPDKMGQPGPSDTDYSMTSQDTE